MVQDIKITDWIMVGITVAYVIATIFICYYNKKAIDGSEKQLKEMKKEFDERKRTKVFI